MPPFEEDLKNSLMPTSRSPKGTWNACHEIVMDDALCSSDFKTVYTQISTLLYHSFHCSAMNSTALKCMLVPGSVFIPPPPETSPYLATPDMWGGNLIQITSMNLQT